MLHKKISMPKSQIIYAMIVVKWSIIVSALVLLSLLFGASLLSAGEFKTHEEFGQLTETERRFQTFEESNGELTSETGFSFHLSKNEYQNVLKNDKPKRSFRMQVRFFDESWQPAKELLFRHGQVGDQAIFYQKAVVV